MGNYPLNFHLTSYVYITAHSFSLRNIAQDDYIILSALLPIKFEVVHFTTVLLILGFASGLSTCSSTVLGLFSRCMFMCAFGQTVPMQMTDWWDKTLRTAKPDANPNTQLASGFMVYCHVHVGQENERCLVSVLYPF